MKYIKQSMWILLICVISEALSQRLPFNLPGSIISIVLTLTVLLTGLLKEEQIKETSEFLLDIMSMLFIPAGVNVYYEVLKLGSTALTLALIVILSMVITFTSTYFVVCGIMRFCQK